MIIRADPTELMYNYHPSSFQRAVVGAIKRHGGWGSVVVLPQNQRYVVLEVHPKLVYGSDAKINFIAEDNGVRVEVYGHRWVRNYSSVGEAVREGLALFREEFARRLAGQMHQVLPGTKWELVPVEED